MFEKLNVPTVPMLPGIIFALAAVVTLPVTVPPPSSARPLARVNVSAERSSVAPLATVTLGLRIEPVAATFSVPLAMVVSPA